MEGRGEEQVVVVVEQKEEVEEEEEETEQPRTEGGAREQTGIFLVLPPALVFLH